MSEAFKQRRLSREQVNQNYVNALDNLETQRLTAWMAELAGLKNEGSSCSALNQAQHKLQADYEAWLKANPEPAEE